MPRHIHPTPFVIKPPADLVEKHPELRRLSHTISMQFAGGVQKREGLTAVVTEEALQVMGRFLWDALPQSVHADFDKVHKNAGAAILPIIVESGKADVQALPWETLLHPELGFLGKHKGFTLSRRMGKPTASPPNLQKGPLRVLLFTSLPDDVDAEHGRLNVEEEQIQVQEALMPWISKGLVELEMPDDGRFSTLKELLDSFHPHVLFLSGHGMFHDKRISDEASYGEFLFEGETGDSHPIRENAIAEALVGMGVQLIVLSACESGKAASDALTNGLAQSLSSQGVPHVIGMRESVLDLAGIQFTRALCDDLAKQEQVDSALQFARIAIQKPFKDPSTGSGHASRRETDLSTAAELSMGQWCLPMLISPDPATPLIDWDFQPQEITTRFVSKSLETISLPQRFVGRRAEMRQYKSDIFKGRIQKLLITGPGGQGKTSLAGKLALDLQARDYRVFAWSARPENPWRDFEFNMELALNEAPAKRYDHFRPRFESDGERAKFMLDLLMEQFKDRVVFFLDNLETAQNPEGEHEITDGTVAAWMETLQKAEKTTLLVTSRWNLPDWDGERLLLTRASYGDFLQMAQQMALRGQLGRSFLAERQRLKHVYDALGGNSRGLEFFAAATLTMESEEEEAFLEKLAQTKGELQANMAIEAIHAHLPEAAKTFLTRLPAHQDPVPAEGMIKLGLDLPEEDPQSLLERLLAVSLVEAQYEPDYEAVQYQCSPLVTDWMREKNLLDGDLKWLDVVADYHVYLRKNERHTLSQSIITHSALRRAGRNADANRLTLDYIVGPFTRAGLYATLLTEWLPPVLNSEDLKTKGDAIGWVGRLHLDLGSYETALTYLKQSLAICQQIGDKAGLCVTLFNMGHIHVQNDQMQEAVSAWVKVYTIAKPMGLANVLQALSKLAPQLGMPEGLEGWEQLAQRMQGGQGENQNEEKSELEQIEEFVTDLVKAAKERNESAPKYFDHVSKFAVDPNAPPHVQELGNVLKQYMSGVKKPDLSKLPKEIAEIVRKAIEE